MPTHTDRHTHTHTHTHRQTDRHTHTRARPVLFQMVVCDHLLMRKFRELLPAAASLRHRPHTLIHTHTHSHTRMHAHTHRFTSSWQMNAEMCHFLFFKEIKLHPILKIYINTKQLLVAIDFHRIFLPNYGRQWLPATVWLPTFFKIYIFVTE